MMDQKRKHINMKEKKNTRRNFLKKAVYSAPGLIILGQLVKPENALGASSTRDGAVW